MTENQSEGMTKYFRDIDRKLKTAYKTASEARKKGVDPKQLVEIPIVKDMAERVEGLVSVAAPQIIGSGISKRIKELETKYGSLDWRISLIIAEEVAKEKFCKFKDKKEAMEVGIRVGFAYHTMGTVSSPLEGFVELKFRQRGDGKEYLALFFSGPIRSAGGTGASVSVLIADYIRKKMGYDVYDPTEEEIKRTVSELYDYHERVTNLQYLPSEEEIVFLIKNIPVQIDGDPSEKLEVSQGKDLKRIETNNIRSGVCLVVGEGIAQKAPKLERQLSKWGEDFGLECWNFLREFARLQKRIKAKTATKPPEKEGKITPDYTFIKDLVAGRPIFTHPLKPGGFRLRYGRGRTSGYSSVCVHPSTMLVSNKYIAVGTQLKTERPGKGAAVTSCTEIEGPIVLLENGDVVVLESEKEAKEHSNNIKKILFLGDILISYGDFFNRTHVLVPPGYCYEWWVQELEKACVEMFGTIDEDKIAEFTGVPNTVVSEVLKNPCCKLSGNYAVLLSKKLNIPVFPLYTPHFNLVCIEELKFFLESLFTSNIIQEEENIEKIVIKSTPKLKECFEKLGIPHLFVNKEFIVIEKDHAIVLTHAFELREKTSDEKIQEETKEDKTNLEKINSFSKLRFRDRSGVFIGARMGRPEKGKIRKLTGSPHVLFPVGQEGGRLRSFQAALEAGKITSDFPLFFCGKCAKETIYPVCEDCGKPTKKKYFCKICGAINSPICTHGDAKPYKQQILDIKKYFESAVKMTKLKVIPDLIKGVRGTSNKEHTPEHIVKGVLRAKHGVFVNKDGTTRYDMSQLPITHFKPKEINVSVEKLKELGYKKDYKGKELINSSQILELKPQDIILPRCEGAPELGSDEILLRVSKFIDDLLSLVYGQKPFYNLKSLDDIIGHLVLCLAPHTSGAIIGRILGFSKTQVFFAHPLLHAATRRDCDGDEACVILLMDALLNFSKEYLPAHRGATQDAPLVITSHLHPTEVDDMVFHLDIASRYPLEFYEACLKYKYPWDVKIPQLMHFLNTPKQYEGMGFTHDVSSINTGVLCSAYKTLPSMAEKLNGQMDLAEKLVSVDESDVARLVIEKHFLKDIKGNLRKFTRQQFRCVGCNEKYRRPPLPGKCRACGGKLIFTISEGSVVKYLEPAIKLGEKYNISPYLKQNLEITKMMIEGIFGKEKETQAGLKKWF